MSLYDYKVECFEHGLRAPGSASPKKAGLSEIEDRVIAHVGHVDPTDSQSPMARAGAAALDPEESIPF
jgi:hypothetical protein